jgi:hypothetical protein
MSRMSCCSCCSVAEPLDRAACMTATHALHRQGQGLVWHKGKTFPRVKGTHNSMHCSTDRVLLSQGAAEPGTAEHGVD